MNILFLGPQGSGKSTQAELLAARYKFIPFETGKRLRKIEETDTAVGQEVRQVLDSGKLISDQLIYYLMKDWLVGIPPTDSVIFDGSPRRETQMRDLEELLTERGGRVDLVFSFLIADAQAVERLLNRVVCQKEEHIYNFVTHPPRVPTMCDIDGSPLFRRSDETPDTIRVRLDHFHEEILPVIASYRNRGILEELDANLPTEEVFRKIREVLIRKFGNL
jgi:adenylate kinase